MKNYAVSLFLGLVLVPILRADDGPKPRSRVERSSTLSRIERKTYRFEEAGMDIEYAQFVPSRYDKAKKSPLVVALHGLGSTPQQIMRYPGLTDLAEKHGYIVVAPMGYNSRGWYGQRIRIGVTPKDPDNLHELSQRDVMNVLEQARRDFSIDPDRIYLMGHSMGGGGTFHLAMEHPQMFAALGPIAPAIFRPVDDLEKIRHIPVILVQGEKDLLVPAKRVRTWADKMKELQMTFEYIEVPGGDHISPAFDELPRIFEFFNKHKKRKPATP